MPSSNGDWRTYAQAMVTYRGVAYSLELFLTAPAWDPVLGGCPRW